MPLLMSLPLEGDMTYAENSSHHHYVTVMDNGRHGYLAGPFRTHREALEWVEPTKKIACEVNSRGIWYAYGTSRVTTKSTPPVGILNAHLGLT